MNDKAINALIAELESQRTLLGNRAAQIAAANAVLAAENETLKKRIAELMPKPDVQPELKAVP